MLDYLYAVTRWKKFILINVFLVTVIAILVSFALPKWYQSTTTILPPQKGDLLSMLGMPGRAMERQLGPLGALTALRGSPEMYRYLAILHSSTFLERVVGEFDLITVYKVEDGRMKDAVEKLQNNMILRVKEEGTLTIEILDRSPDRVFEMTNFSVFLLDSLNTELGAREARSNREFIGRRLRETEEQLRITEEKIREFQKDYGFMVIPEYVEGSAMAIAELYSAKILAEIEYDVLRETLGVDNPLIRATKVRLDELNRRLGEFPDLGVEFFRLYRDYSIQQTIFETLMPIYEHSRIEEHRDTPTLLVLDYARYPERHHKPRKSIIVMVFFALSLIISIAVVLITDNIERMKTSDPERHKLLTSVWMNLRNWSEKKTLRE